MTKLGMTFKNPLQVTIESEWGQTLVTDAPKIHGGLEEGMSPTDLVAAALGSCILTIMGVYAKKLGVDIEGTQLRIEKEMASQAPRRIGKFIIEITWAKTYPAEIEAKLKEAVHNCPVHHSLHPEIVVEERFYAAEK